MYTFMLKSYKKNTLCEANFSNFTGGFTFNTLFLCVYKAITIPWTLLYCPNTSFVIINKQVIHSFKPKSILVMCQALWKTIYKEELQKRRAKNTSAGLACTTPGP